MTEKSAYFVNLDNTAVETDKIVGNYIKEKNPDWIKSGQKDGFLASALVHGEKNNNQEAILDLISQFGPEARSDLFDPKKSGLDISIKNSTIITRPKPFELVKPWQFKKAQQVLGEDVNIHFVPEDDEKIAKIQKLVREKIENNEEFGDIIIIDDRDFSEKQQAIAREMQREFVKNQVKLLLVNIYAKGGISIEEVKYAA
jgi:hypothetical protein